MSHSRLNHKRLFALASLTILLLSVYVPLARFGVFADVSWLSGWSRRRQLTINGSLVAETLTDFPVLVKLDSSFFDFSKANSSGEDVRFTSSDGTTPLKYQIEKWNNASGEAYIWVKIPSVASGSATTFYMYYGNPAALDAQDRANVWNSNFKMVQHLKETSGTHADSTSNANDGSPYNGVVQGTTGKIDGADSFDGSNDYVDCGNSSSLTQTEFTIEAWVKRNGNGVTTTTGTGGMTAAEPLIAKGRGYSETIGLNVNYFLGINQGNKTFGFDFEDNINGLNHPISGATPVADGQWYYVAATHNGTSALYVNGALDASNLTARTPDYNPWSVSLSTAISGAGAGTPAGYFNGIVDEVRISNKAFSASWIKASYHSGSNSLLTYGNEEVSGIPLTLTLTDPQNVTYYETSIALRGYADLYANITYQLDGQANVSLVNNTISFQTSLTGLSYGSHAVTVFAFESMNASNTATSTVYFTVEKASWLPGWSYRRQLVVNGTLVVEALTDFPVLVRLDSSFLNFSKVKDNGEDVRFTGSDGTTLLKYEIERWNKTAGKAEVWVKIPSVSAVTNTTIYLYYGDSEASDAQDPANVWNSNFNMVQHLKETSGLQYDSTSNHNDASAVGTVNRNVEGKIDGADSLPGTNNNYLNCGNKASLTITTYTIEAWIKRLGTGVATSTGSGGVVAEPMFAKGRAYSDTAGLNVNYFLGINQSGNVVAFDFEAADSSPVGLNYPSLGTTSLVNDQWYYVALTYNGTSTIYVNGILDSSTVVSKTPDYNPWDATIGTAIAGAGAGTADGAFNGTIDEVRLSNKAYSAAWLRVTYYSESDSLLIYGIEEVAPPVPTYSHIATTATHAAYSCEFQVEWSDSNGLDTCIFTTDNTGTWQNYTIPVSGTVSWANKTLTLNSVPGTTVGYRWYCNNTLGNTGDTGTRTLVTTGDWPYAMKLYFNNTGISETLADFPVLINLSRAGSDFWSHVSPTVDDLRFVSYDSVTNLYFEVEYWNYSANMAYVWVKVPQIDANSTSNFVYVYYGNPSPPTSPYRDSTKVWTDSFRLVQHLEEGSGVQYDSTSYHNDATAVGTVDRTTAGLIDGADAFNGANGNYLNCGNGSALTVTQYTIEALIKRNGNGIATNTGTGGFYGEPIVAKGRAYVETLGFNINYFLSINQTGNVIGFDFEDNVNGGNHPVFSNSAIQNGQWYYIALTYDGTARIYINGNLDKSTLIGFTPDYNQWATAIGSAIAGAGSGTADGAFNGTIDEVRISYVVRSQEWVRAQNLSMNDQYVTFGAEQAPNTAPDKPFNPFPQNNAVGIPVSAELSVNVSDPDGNTMDVYFYQPGVEAPPAENFTIVALPDTQIYSSTYPSVFTNQTLWVVDNQTANDIKFVTHEGDIVNTLTIASEWQNANTSMSKLDGKVPYGFSPGNHDGAGTDTSTYNNYFGYGRYSAETWYGGAYNNDNNNSYQLFSVGDDNYLFLHLQYDPNTQILAWANSTLNSHSDRRVIVTTHEYLDATGTRTTIGNNIWNNFIFYHTDQIFLVLCGHYSREARRTDTVNGHNVYQLLADYQTDANGGNGWLRLIEFHPAEDKIYVKTYSPYLNSFETDSGSRFTLDYDLSYAGSSGPQLIGVAHDVPSGLRATVSWTGLDYSTTYHWYTVAVDSQGAPTQSDTWSFTTTAHTYALTVSTAGSGSVNLNNTGPYYYGDVVQLTAVPSTGWSFDHWSGDLGGSANPTTILIDGDKAVTATFTQNLYTLTTSVVGSGSVNRNDSGPYHYGDTVELTAVPLTGWSFDHWDGDLTGSANPATILVDEDKDVRATFTQNAYTLTVLTEGSGSVDRNSSGPYYYGDTVQLTAVPTAGWSFDRWGGDLTGSTNPTTILIDGDKDVNATFTQNEYTLETSVIGSGVVNLNNTGPYHYGDVVELTAVPNDGWSFEHWSGDLIGSTNPDTVTITANETVTATFTQNTYTLTISTEGSGSVSRNNTGPYYYGDVVELTGVPDSGWAFDHWSGDLVGFSNPDTVVMTSDKAVTAHFTAVVVGNHDVAVTNVTSYRRVVGEGFVNNITVTVQNQGDFPETFNVTVRLNATDIGQKEVTLSSGNSVSIIFEWNSSGFVYANYTLSAYAWPVQNETDIEDNTFVGGRLAVSIPGDVDGDGTVNILDAILMSNTFIVSPLSVNWNPDADIDSNGVVNILDAIILSNHFLMHYL